MTKKIVPIVSLLLTFNFSLMAQSDLGKNQKFLYFQNMNINSNNDFQLINELDHTNLPSYYYRSFLSSGKVPELIEYWEHFQNRNYLVFQLYQPTLVGYKFRNINTNELFENDKRIPPTESLLENKTSLISDESSAPELLGHQYTKGRILAKDSAVGYVETNNNENVIQTKSWYNSEGKRTRYDIYKDGKLELRIFYLKTKIGRVDYFLSSGELEYSFINVRKANGETVYLLKRDGKEKIVSYQTFSKSESVESKLMVDYRKKLSLHFIHENEMLSLNIFDDNEKYLASVPDYNLERVDGRGSSNAANE